jgi:hypothetical protein
MGIETLQSAARAAGFAMAASDEGEEEQTSGSLERKEWQPTQALLLPLAEPHQPGKLEALKALLTYFGRRAPASPA